MTTMRLSLLSVPALLAACQTSQSLIDYGPCGPGTSVVDAASSPFGVPPQTTQQDVAGFRAEITWASQENLVETVWEHEPVGDAFLTVFDATCGEPPIRMSTRGMFEPAQIESGFYATWASPTAPAVFTVPVAWNNNPAATQWMKDVLGLQGAYEHQIVFSDQGVSLTLVGDDGSSHGGDEPSFQGTVVYTPL